MTGLARILKPQVLVSLHRDQWPLLFCRAASAPVSDGPPFKVAN
jgi:hypothetical protein